MQNYLQLCTCRGRRIFFFKTGRVENIFGVGKLTEVFFLTIIKFEKYTAITDKENNR